MMREFLALREYHALGQVFYNCLRSERALMLLGIRNMAPPASLALWEPLPAYWVIPEAGEAAAGTPQTPS